jgi:hypothetical protein
MLPIIDKTRGGRLRAFEGIYEDVDKAWDKVMNLDRL